MPNVNKIDDGFLMGWEIVGQVLYRKRNKVSIILGSFLDNDSFYSGTGSGADPSLKPIYDQTGEPWHIHDPSKIVPTDGILMIADTGKAQEDGYK